MKKWTGFVILFGLIGVVIYDIAAFIFFENATISVFATDLAKVSPVFGYSVTAVLGILIGHWFIPAKGSDDE